MTVEQILNEAFRLGRDLESHADDQRSNPDNWDSVCEYVAVQMAALMDQLKTLNQGGVDARAMA